MLIDVNSLKIATGFQDISVLLFHFLARNLPLGWRKFQGALKLFLASHDYSQEIFSATSYEL